MGDELKEAYNEMIYSKHFGGHRYKQAKAHYENVLKEHKKELKEQYMKEILKTLEAKEALERNRNESEGTEPKAG